VLVLLSAVADTVDGAVAVIAGRATRLGQVDDSLADRLGEACWLVALWLVGAPGWLDAPGARSPVSSDPLFKTTRWVMPSTLCQTTIWPAGNVPGFGENDCAPLLPTMLMITASAGGTVEPVGVVGDVPP
jgi:hypothetical protein